MASQSPTEITYRFLCGLRGYHVYNKDWKPRIDEILSAVHEQNNLYDRYAIVAQKKLPGQLEPSTIGHLPKEISRFTRFIIHYGATVTVRVISDNHRRSPLIQGGLEIPVEVSVMMISSENNNAALANYKELVSQNYKEPVDGNFEDVTDMILKEFESDSESTASTSNSEDCDDKPK